MRVAVDLREARGRDLLPYQVGWRDEMQHQEGCEPLHGADGRERLYGELLELL